MTRTRGDACRTYDCRGCGKLCNEFSWGRWAKAEMCRRCYQKRAGLLFQEAKRARDMRRNGLVQTSFPFLPPSDG